MSWLPRFLLVSSLVIAGAAPGASGELKESAASGVPPRCTIRLNGKLRLPVYDRPYGKPVSQLHRREQVTAFYHHLVRGERWANVARFYPEAASGFALKAHLLCDGRSSKEYSGREACLAHPAHGGFLRVLSSPGGESVGIIRRGLRVAVIPEESDDPAYVWVEYASLDNPLGHVLARDLACREYDETE
jgi:hypothetical protein